MNSRFASARYLTLPASLSVANREETVPAEQRASYAAIIDEILSTADLETISAKRIRNALQERVDCDLSGQKVCGNGNKIAGMYVC